MVISYKPTNPSCSTYDPSQNQLTEVDHPKQVLHCQVSPEVPADAAHEWHITAPRWIHFFAGGRGGMSIGRDWPCE